MTQTHPNLCHPFNAKFEWTNNKLWGHFIAALQTATALSQSISFPFHEKTLRFYSCLRIRPVNLLCVRCIFVAC